MFRLALVLWCVAVCRLEPMADAVAFYPSHSHDFGVIYEDNGDVSCQFRIINDGSNPLVIFKVLASCGCMNVDYPKAPINPGDTACIAVTFSPADLPGRFSKSIYIETNSNPGSTTLHVRGTVIARNEYLDRHYPAKYGPLRLEKNQVDFGKAKKGKAVTAYIEGYNMSADTLRLAISKVPGFMEVEPSQTVVGPGEHVTFMAKAVAGESMSQGCVIDTMSIATTSESVVKLPVKLDVIATPTR